MKKLLLGLSLAALPLTFSLTAMGQCQPKFEITRLCQVDNRHDGGRACDAAAGISVNVQEALTVVKPKVVAA